MQKYLYIVNIRFFKESLSFRVRMHEPARQSKHPVVLTGCLGCSWTGVLVFYDDG